MVTTTTPCPRPNCTAAVFRDSEDTYTCIVHGEFYVVPPEVHKMLAYREEHCHNGHSRLMYEAWDITGRKFCRACVRMKKRVSP